MTRPPPVLLLPLLLVLDPRLCTASGTLLSGQSFTSDDRTIVSSDNSFALGFFSPSNSSSSSSYLGIWYNNNHIPNRRVVWVANRAAPIRFPPGNLTIFPASSILVLSDSRGTILWSSHSSNATTTTNTTTQGRAASAVLDTNGNLQLRGDDDTVLWQSRDDPTDTILADTKFWANRETRTAQSIISWASQGDPSPGNFSFGMDPENPFQFVTWRGGKKKKKEKKFWRSSVWQGASFSGINMGHLTLMLSFQEGGPWRNTTFGFGFSRTSSPVPVPNLRLNPDGRLQLQVWNPTSQSWLLEPYPALNSCQEYAHCGAFGYCNISADQPACRCLDRFHPKSKADWDAGFFAGGCVRNEPLRCDADVHDDDEFVRLDGMKLPDHLVDLGNVGVDRCVETCRKNCSCIAYVISVPNLRRTTCFVWIDALIDMAFENASLGEELLDVRGQELFVRVASTQSGNVSKPRVIRVVLLTSVFSVALLVAALCYLVWKCRRHLREKLKSREENNEIGDDLPAVELDISFEVMPNLPSMEFDDLLAATDQFSDACKIGHGGFGVVYKGKLLGGGQEVAIKRLSRSSRQGIVEFGNEVQLTAQLRHRNLVRLLGYCIRGTEKLLVYEYMPNKSLDFFLFGDLEKKLVLNWEMRFIIIKGIARGLRYLHEDSRLRIIHRDLKSGNILLDGDMNPRISDLGMARSFVGIQNRAFTRKIVGTHGYMSPEYGMCGNYSVKSDVYSFGIIVLEIIVGRSSHGFCDDQHYSLTSYAWESWRSGAVVDIVDPSMGDSCKLDEVLRCLHIGLLCVQDRTKDRLSMSTAVFMLENNSPIYETPKRPTFTPQTKHNDSEGGRTSGAEGSLNTVTTLTDARSATVTDASSATVTDASSATVTDASSATVSNAHSTNTG